jgi:hypothetical protein
VQALAFTVDSQRREIVGLSKGSTRGSHPSRIDAKLGDQLLQADVAVLIPLAGESDYVWIADHTGVVPNEALQRYGRKDEGRFRSDP